MPPERRPRGDMHGQRNLPLLPLRLWSPSWQEDRQLPPPRNLSPSSRHEEKPLADSDTLPALWRNEAMHAEEKARHTNEELSIIKHAKVHFQRAAERRQRNPKDDHRERESGSSSGGSLGGSPTNVEFSVGNLGKRNLSLSDSFDVIEHERAGSGDDDDDEYVHVLHSPPG